MNTLRLALDWTPNTNHIGFFVAQALGFYENEGISLELISPKEDDYSVTPAKKVELGQADMALCPLESVISYRTKNNPFDAMALATVFQEDLSAIVVLEESRIKSPRDLDGCSYASYKARYEDEIVKQMIINDGGEGKLELSYPEKLGIWDTLLTKKYDSTWIFMNWEGVHANAKGINLRSFKLADYDIPYGYSPVLFASKSKVDTGKEIYEAFLRATKKGFLFAMKSVEKAAKILEPFVAQADAGIDLINSQMESIPTYGNQDSWGQLKRERVELFLNWLNERNLEKSKLGYNDLIYQGLNF